MRTDPNNPSHPLVQLAKAAIECYIDSGQSLPVPAEPVKEMQDRAGVFVSLKKHGQLRGCIGTFTPMTQNVASEVIRNAIAAATEDPRFSPVRAEELQELNISVDVLSAPEKVNDISELDHKKYGVIVAKDYRKGLLLPDIDGVDSVEEQLRIAKLKANIYPNEPVEIFRFEVRRYY
ncbi:MAG: AmmeMemoRadiSam system protein A [Nitrospirae bacterium]|nr:AmmeMemoRadiSam system protein A [Nitrospirota bacterium]MBF0592016.1 AmmeMemoRadiSam system protein A [Nitrospirota bacterium]